MNLKYGNFRRCTQCKQLKPATNEFFRKDRSRYLGLGYRCKGCDKERVDNRTYKERISKMSPESIKKLKATQSKYGKTIKGKSIQLFKAYQAYDKKKGFTTTITKEDILTVKNSLCIYCDHIATGFDRINNKEGHTRENCVPCCKECNIARMDNFTHEEMKIIGKTIKEIKDARKNTVLIPLNY